MPTSIWPLVLYRFFDSCLVLPCRKRFSSSSLSSLSSLSLSFLHLSGRSLPNGFSNALLALLLSHFVSDSAPIFKL